ncbi:MAG: helicase-related protein, partial [Ginsengibacter sp.]
TDENNCFYDAVKEIKTIINDYELLCAVNFPEKENQREIENKLIFQSPIKGMSGIKKNKGKVATQFRMPGYPFVLVTTDIYREGEDLHTYCQNIYHYGIAWNCSDMEQRTGRIDRINSLSNRKMINLQRKGFDEKLHVFYPYLEKTLEVNQVNKLFTSMNQFVQAFDIVDSINEDGLASTKSAIEEIPKELDIYMKSKFEHDSFKGYLDNGNTLKLNSLIGYNRTDIEECLKKINLRIQTSGQFHLEPQINFEDFKIIGDYNLQKRKYRRGPFRILIKTDIYPGKFTIEISSYLFKASTKIQKAYNENIINGIFTRRMFDIDDYHAIGQNYSMDNINIDKLTEDLLLLVNDSDEWEEKISGLDSIVFG